MAVVQRNNNKKPNKCYNKNNKGNFKKNWNENILTHTLQTKNNT